MHRLGWNLVSVLAVAILCLSCQNTPQTPTPDQINLQIAEGNYTTATQLINEYVAVTVLTAEEALDWEWKKEWMSRMRIDFSSTPESMLAYVRNYVPDVSPSQIDQWEASRALEGMYIDGEKFYFNRGPRNLFRIDSAMCALYEQVEGPDLDSKDTLLWEHLPQIIQNATKSGQELVEPRTYNITFRLSVPANTVPDGELLRVWMPLPRTDIDRQKDFRLIHASQSNYLISPDSYDHKSIYMERVAQKDKDTDFEYTFEYTAYARYALFDPEKDVLPYNTQDVDYLKYTQERLPHIILNDRIKELSAELTKGITNPYQKIQNIFSYLDTYPWAGAREYSTIDCIPLYVLDNHHGDCGQVSLLFISLCRAAGIPARWQSGWMLHPDNENLHDWGEAYLEGVGWIPIDQSFGLQQEGPDYWFFTRGMDSYRMVVNSDYGAAFFPAKIFPRSETVDFQRGEVEWRGGNLYFDKWDYDLTVNSIR